MSSAKKTQFFEINSSAPKKNALGKNIMQSLTDKVLLLILITTITVTPIAILKQTSKLQNEKGVPQNEMGICLISEH